MTDSEKKIVIDSLKFPLTFIVLIWVIHIFQVFFKFDLGYWGIYPRTLIGMRGIFFAPLIHSDWAHLFSNTIPVFSMIFIIKYFYDKIAVRSFFIIYILTGFFVWIFARNVFHIGASGVSYGLVSFIFWMGVFRRSIRAIILAMIVTVVYSGMIIGVLPNQEGISWESHLIGALVGIFTAYIFKDELQTEEEQEIAQKNSLKYTTVKTHFFARDAFEMTKLERQIEAERIRLENERNYWVQMWHHQNNILNEINQQRIL
ncbi:MAG: rhomboid family intramembrane serine protease [Saprospiraceae bacterium]|nr:rhomboid family intramembrane serine protease [Saprospiraceae bacterium]